MKTNNILKIGSGYIKRIYEILDGYGIKGKILYVTGPVVDSLYGSIVRPQIEAVGKLKEETVTNNTIAYAMTVAERVIATDIDCIIGMGGGKVLDVCKYAAYISKKPLLSIATTMANDGIASPIAVLKRQDGKPKSLGCASPSILVIDTDVIAKSPIELIKAGIGDTISNYTALLDWKLAVQRGKDEMNGYAYLMSQTSLDTLMRTQYDSLCPAFIEVLAHALVLSGIAMDFTGSSRPVSGSEHLFSHALDYYGKAENLHGFQVALGTIAVLKLMGKSCDSVIRYLRRFDVNVNPIKMGIDREIFTFCMQNGTKMRKDRYTYLHEADLSDERLHMIYDELVEKL